jgi:hypothetical protein
MISKDIGTKHSSSSSIFPKHNFQIYSPSDIFQKVLVAILICVYLVNMSQDKFQEDRNVSREMAAYRRRAIILLFSFLSMFSVVALVTLFRSLDQELFSRFDILGFILAISAIGTLLLKVLQNSLKSPRNYDIHYSSDLIKHYKDFYKTYPFDNHISSDKALNNYIELLEKDTSKKKNRDHVIETVENAKVRLQKEVFALGTRAHVNLVIGIIITVVGLFLLWTFINEGVFSSSDGAYVFSARISLVLLIQVFSYFFLRLYKNGLDEIKYFQNEITNLDHFLTAIHMSKKTEGDETVKLIINKMTSCDRNKSGDLASSCKTLEHEALLEVIKKLLVTSSSR